MQPISNTSRPLFRHASFDSGRRRHTWQIIPEQDGLPSVRCFPKCDPQRPPVGNAISSHRQQPCSLKSSPGSIPLSQSQPFPSLSVTNFNGRAGLWVSVLISSLSSFSLMVLFLSVYCLWVMLLSVILYWPNPCHTNNVIPNVSTTFRDQLRQSCLTVPSPLEMISFCFPLA